MSLQPHAFLQFGLQLKPCYLMVLSQKNLITYRVGIKDISWSCSIRHVTSHHGLIFLLSLVHSQEIASNKVVTLFHVLPSLTFDLKQRFSAITVDRTNPCRLGNPASHRNQTRIVCGPNDSSTCPRNYYCHLGETPETTACCESSGCKGYTFRNVYSLWTPYLLQIVLQWPISAC